jgi:preprotein translocase subunit SecD
LFVEREAFLTEAFVSEAKVISVMDGFSLTLQFDRRGSLLLEQYSAGNRGRHFAVRVRFGKNLDQTRWLAAPIIASRISNGVLTFTPDATREEADQIVLGLNNIAKKVRDKSSW